MIHFAVPEIVLAHFDPAFSRHSAWPGSVSDTSLLKAVHKDIIRLATLKDRFTLLLGTCGPLFDAVDGSLINNIQALNASSASISTSRLLRVITCLVTTRSCFVSVSLPLTPAFDLKILSQLVTFKVIHRQVSSGRGSCYRNPDIRLQSNGMSHCI